ncbi:MAG: AmmeMemoRadiSam system protein B [Haloarculaceae archaeon]
MADAVAAGHSMCGPWATVAGLTAARELGAGSGRRLHYATSARTVGDPERVVGYCSVVPC